MGKGKFIYMRPQSVQKEYRNYGTGKKTVSMLARLAGAAITKYHRLGWFKQQTFNSLSSGG